MGIGTYKAGKLAECDTRGGESTRLSALIDIRSISMFIKRLRRVWLLALCLAKSILYGRANKIPSNPSRIIVVPAGKLGDVVCGTPVLFAIKKYLPKAHLIVAGNSKLHRPLLADSGLVDEYLDLYDSDSRALKRIRASHADVAILTGPSFESVALFYLAGVPLIVAPRGAGNFPYSEITRPYRILQRLIKTFPYRLGEYAPRIRLKALWPIGISSEDATKHLGFSKDGEKRVQDLISQIPSSYKYLVGISPAAGNKEKQWPPTKFGDVANYLIKKHDAHVVVIGGKNDISESNEMIAAIDDKSKVTDTTAVSIDELKAFISKLDIFISVNTGPLYIAEAFNIPTVDLIGPVNAWDQPPQGKIHKMVFAPGNPKPLLSIMNSRDHDVKEAERIAESTRVEDVISAAREALKEADLKKG